MRGWWTQALRHHFGKQLPATLLPHCAAPVERIVGGEPGQAVSHTWAFARHLKLLDTEAHQVSVGIIRSHGPLPIAFGLC
jgi:hypothetical protein